MEAPAAYAHKIARNADDARSSSSISSPPNSPPHKGSSQDTIRVARPPFPTPGFSGGGVANAPSATSAPASNAAAHTANSNTSPVITSASNGTAPEKPKRQRKKKEVGADGKPVVEEKPKKTRKPRDPNKTAPTNGAGEKAAPSRAKKVKTEDKTAAQDVPTQPRQPTITQTFSAAPQQQNHPQQPLSSTPTPVPQPPSSQHRLSDTIMPNHLPPSVQTYTAATPRPYSSGQSYYDPIRGSTKESVPPRSSNPPTAVSSAQASPHVNRASESPAIAGLIDPPTAIKASAPPPAHSPQTTFQQPFVSSQQSPTPHKTTSAFAPPPMSSPNGSSRPIPAMMDGAMDIDPKSKAPMPSDFEINKTLSKSSSPAPTPKQARPTPPPAPKGTGSGLLSSSDLFGGPSTSEPAERKGVDIDIRIVLNPAGGNIINIAQEIENKYGRDAINPRAAAHREQLMRMAAEQNKFADGTGDDMSVDLTSDVEDNSNVEMGGMDEDKSNTGLETDNKPTRKRKKRTEEYDKEDDFIDDAELAWQEQAAVAKDGFFVFSGPLIPEGQEPQIESAAPTRGRGSRARGRGGRAAAAGTTHASLADKTRDATTTRGRTRGTRGTGAPRKPRITKADRERMENEKLQRERDAAGLAGPPTASTSSLAPPPSVTHMPAAHQQHTPMPMQPPAPHRHPPFAQPMSVQE